MDAVINKPTSIEILQQSIFEQHEKRLKNRKIDSDSKEYCAALPIIEKNATQELLEALVMCLAEIRMKLNDARQTGNMNTLLAVIHKIYDGLCYTHTPRLRKTIHIFMQFLKNNISETEEHYFSVLKELNTFETTYQVMGIK